MGIKPDNWQVLGAFIVYLVGVAGLGILSHRYLTRGSFVKEYFVGNRGLGPWVLALTVAATAIQSAPEVLRQIHADYLAAGAEVVTANTFRTHERNLRAGGISGNGDMASS